MEHFECKIGNSTKWLVSKCEAKPSDQIKSDRFNVTFQSTIVQPVSKLYIHVIVFYKYQTYKKFPIDIWEEACGFLNGKQQSYTMELFQQIDQFIKYNGKLKCPLIGNLTIEFYNLSVNKQFPLLPILPTGQFIFQSDYFEYDRVTLVASTKAFVEITQRSSK